VTPAPTETPRDKGAGCIGKGCLLGAGLLLFLTVAFVAGSYFAVNHLRDKYSSSEPMELPEVTNEEDFVASAPASTTPGGAIAGTPAPVPVQKRWKAFEKADERNENANIVLTAGEINSLLSSGKNTRGKAFVSIDNNIARVRVSIPLDKIYTMEGRYLNGEATVQSSPDGNPGSARISNIILNNQAVPDSILDTRLFGWSSIRSHINGWLAKEQITSFKIQDNKVIGQKGGGSGF
jgi:hypothetical protein